MIETYFSGWVDYRSEIKMLDSGDDVVVLIHEVARMRGCDAVVARDVSVWTIRDGNWVFWRIMPSREAALEAAGVAI